MFWSPLMALLGGCREKEIPQLSPDDFETTGGIHHYRLRNMPGNSIKSDAGHRMIPFRAFVDAPDIIARVKDQPLR